MITAREIIKVVAEEFDLTMVDMSKATHKWRISRPRQAAMYAVRTMRPDMSYPMIGRIFGLRDHTTIIHGVRAVQRRIEQDPEVRAKVEKALARISKRMEAAA